MYGYAEEPSLAAYDTVSCYISYPMTNYSVDVKFNINWSQVDASASYLYNILLQDQTDEALFNRKWNFLSKTVSIKFYFELNLLTLILLT